MHRQLAAPGADRCAPAPPERATALLKPVARSTATTPLHPLVLPAGPGAALFDSNSPGVVRQFSLADLAPLLSPGEVLRIRRSGAGNAPELLMFKGAEEMAQMWSPGLSRLIGQLPVDGHD